MEKNRDDREKEGEIKKVEKTSSAYGNEKMTYFCTHL